GNNGGHRLTLITRFATSHGVVGNFLAVIGPDLDEWLGQRLDVTSGQDGNYAGHGFGSCGIYAHDAGVGIRRADKSQPAHLPQLDIVDELAFAAQQPAFLLAGERLTYPFFLVSVFAVATHVQSFGRDISVVM